MSERPQVMENMQKENAFGQTTAAYQAPDLIETARRLAIEMDSGTGDAIVAAIDRLRARVKELEHAD